MFIGREKELADLNALYATDQFQMPVIYGRRRVGKSTLVHKFIEDKKAVVFTAIESTLDRNLELFSKSIYKALLPTMNHMPPFQSLDAAFDFLTEYVNLHELYGKSGAGVSEPALWQKNRADQIASV